MNREVHIRICGRLGVKVPGPTRREPLLFCAIIAGVARPMGGQPKSKAFSLSSAEAGRL
jgi:hypothetical protein